MFLLGTYFSPDARISPQKCILTFLWDFSSGKYGFDQDYLELRAV